MPQIFPPTIRDQQLSSNNDPDEPKKNIKEDVRDKNKIKITEGRKLRIIYVCEREVALQLDNQLSW